MREECDTQRKEGWKGENQLGERNQMQGMGSEEEVGAVV